MTILSFEEAVAKLANQMANASPIDQELAMMRLSLAIADTKRPNLKVVPETDDNYFDNVPL